jgi:hypothetical protein
MEEKQEGLRIAIVGAGPGYSARLLQKLRELGHEAILLPELHDAIALSTHDVIDVVRPEDLVRFGREHARADVVVPLVLPKLADPRIEFDVERTPPHGWYQQFAGKRGRPPRY